MASLSPLRYPGGKSRAVKTLSNYLIKDIKEICSPFFGGGSFELDCASKGIKVVGYDVLDPLVSFWKSIIKDPKKLSINIQKHLPLTKEEFNLLKKEITKEEDEIILGSLFYVINRSSFSGSTLSGGMSPNHPRFNQASIDKVRDFNVKNFTVEKLSFKDSILLNKGKFFYLDPPYLLENSNLYGTNGDTHKDFDHQLLKDLITKEDNWMMSYNNCESVLDLYKDYNYIFPDWKYGMSKDKNSNEVLIFSKKVYEQLKKESKL